MQYFWETTGTIIKGVGFKAFDSCHIAWLIFAVIAISALSALYKKQNAEKRKITRFAVAAAILLNEIIKTVILVAVGRWTKNYLPIHLCTINIFMIAYHCFKPSKTVDNFLYSICVPGALMALLFPSWTKLPFMNFMHLHSFTIHILLMAYPIMLTVGGDIKPSAKYILKSVALLLCMAVPVYFINIILDTNYMFLMEAEKGTPLVFFKQAFGSHLVAFPVLLSLLYVLLYTPWEIARISKKNGGVHMRSLSLFTLKR